MKELTEYWRSYNMNGEWYGSVMCHGRRAEKCMCRLV